MLFGVEFGPKLEDENSSERFTAEMEFRKIDPRSPKCLGFLNTFFQYYRNAFQNFQSTSFLSGKKGLNQTFRHWMYCLLTEVVS
jgi:hypothetical protein